MSSAALVRFCEWADAPLAKSGASVHSEIDDFEKKNNKRLCATSQSLPSRCRVSSLQQSVFRMTALLPSSCPTGYILFPSANGVTQFAFSSARSRGSLNSLKHRNKDYDRETEYAMQQLPASRPMLPPEILLMPRQEARRLIRKAVVVGILGGYLTVHLDGGEREHIHAHPPSRCTTYPLPQSVQIRSLSGRDMPKKFARAVKPVFYYGASAFRSRPLLNILF